MATESERKASFTDGAAYERLMAAWSRSVGEVFLDWLGVGAGQRWLDVGCGTGVFTELVYDRCAPAEIAAIDPAPEQIAFARTKPIARKMEFRVGDAQALPFPDQMFDVVASALVINFIPDRPIALAEMRRVARPGGLVAGYVWDFTAMRAPTGPLLRGMQQTGIEPPMAMGTAASSIDALAALFKAAGLEAVATRAIEVTVSFPDFDDLWTSITPSYAALGKVTAALPATERDRLKEAVRAQLSTEPNGRLAYASLANAVKAIAP